MAYQYMKTGSGYESSKYHEIMVDSQADLADLDLKDIAPGSVAYTCKPGEGALDELWMLSSARTWEPM